MTVRSGINCEDSLYSGINELQFGLKQRSQELLTLIIRLKARLQSNIGFTLRRILMVFMSSGIVRRK